MPHPDSPHHDLIHKAMQYPAPVPVEISQKPESITYFDSEGIENAKQLMHMDNVVRNLGNSAIDLQNKIDTDELTGAGSKTKGLSRMEEIVDSGRKLEIFYLDFDNFKEVNDTLGHEAGDKTLISLVTSLIGSLRDGETLHRFGGDEFVIVKDASVISDRRRIFSRVKKNRRDAPDRRSVTNNSEVEGLRSRFTEAFDEGVEALEEILGEELGNKMGLSIGHSTHKKGQSIQELLSEADISMYEDKQKHKQAQAI